MSEPTTGMSPKAALRLEVFIIGLGLLALLLIFQPFSITVFAIGSGLVVLAGLVNNLLPLAQPGVSLRSVFVVALVVAMIFCIVLLVSMTAAHLYGVFFLQPPDPNTMTGKAALATPPYYMQPFVWTLAIIAAGLAVIITYMNKTKR
jgi:glucan phosphoethanolaminetransferase (alkaline phosphatase superfamily)